VPGFRAADGTQLAYRVAGEGVPLICVPGGPMRASSYLGDLGGLSAHRRLVLPDLRGTGASATPSDPASYRCDRLVDDVVALLDHLGLARADVLAHSAGASIAVQLAARQPERVSRLALITPGGQAVGLDRSREVQREVLALRREEPWYPGAAAAFSRVVDGTADDADWETMAPLYYGHWDAAAQAHDAANEEEVNERAAAVFGSPGAFDPPATRAALATLAAPVLVYAGEVDLAWPSRIVAEYVPLFPAGRFVEQPGAGHFPWLDDAAWFRSAVTEFLD
jgi:pimeloyl-ACP methyl ester carboxylesterase